MLFSPVNPKPERAISTRAIKSSTPCDVAQAQSGQAVAPTANSLTHNGRGEVLGNGPIPEHAVSAKRLNVHIDTLLQKAQKCPAPITDLFIVAQILSSCLPGGQAALLFGAEQARSRAHWSSSCCRGCRDHCCATGHARCTLGATSGWNNASATHAWST
jgi:hypothetical protein